MALSLIERREAVGAPRMEMFLDGVWKAGEGDTWTHVHPSSGEVLATFPTASGHQVDMAVQAARRAFDEGPWPRLDARSRAGALRRLADLFASNAERLAALTALDNGMPMSLAVASGPELAADVFDYYSGWVDKITGSTLPQYRPGDPFVMTLQEPIGVAAVISPWNAPIVLLAHKVAPALAAGCTIVAKPSEFAPFTSFGMAELLAEADLPPGVFNMVAGPGETTGQALIEHEGVDKYSFTGSRAVGAHIAATAGARVARVSLELGGKSPAIVYPDAPRLDEALQLIGGMAYMGLSGQVCVTQSRVLAHVDVYDKVIEGLGFLAQFASYGDPFDPATLSAPMITQRHLDRVMGYIARGQEEGARLVFGGDRPQGELAGGTFINPTLFADVDNSMVIGREEIFGPVLSVIPFRNDEEAVRIANDTPYGLGAAVYTDDVRRGLAIARAVRAGNVGINSWTYRPHHPFGGFKSSGLGREGSVEGIHEYLESKAVFIGA